ncbi:hypothetical protein D3C85_693440 [compost metagenome]
MKESDRFKLISDYYSYSILTCTYVDGFGENKTAYLVNAERTEHYKYNVKKQKLYKWSSKYSSWDSSLAQLTPYGDEEIWHERMTTNFVGD